MYAILEKTARQYKRLNTRCEALSVPRTRQVLCVDIARQRLSLFEGESLQHTYIVSTSRRPPSCIEESLGTPLGLHRIAQKIGDGSPVGTVFRGRVSIGQTWQELAASEAAENCITSRILWLEGLQDGHNRGPGRDTFKRYIYLHGTNQHERLGQPNSHGCILLSDADIIELHDRLEVGTLVWIDLGNDAEPRG
ncbi:MAG: L,D-transpeptidase [Opitutales bacterium]